MLIEKPKVQKLDEEPSKFALNMALMKWEETKHTSNPRLFGGALLNKEEKKQWDQVLRDAMVWTAISDLKSGFAKNPDSIPDDIKKLAKEVFDNRTPNELKAMEQLDKARLATANGDTSNALYKADEKVSKADQQSIENQCKVDFDNPQKAVDCALDINKLFRQRQGKLADEIGHEVSAKNGANGPG